MENGVEFRFEKQGKSFCILTNFVDKWYQYSETRGEYLFTRFWKSDSSPNSVSHLYYKNLTFVANPVQPICWSLYLEEEKRQILIKRGRYKLEYGIAQNDSWFSPDSMQIVEFQKSIQTRKNEIVTRIIEQAKQEYRDLYDKIQDKEDCLNDLKDFYHYEITGKEKEAEILKYVLECKEKFLNYAKAESIIANMRENLDFEFLLKEIPVINQYIEEKRIDEKTVLDIAENAVIPSIEATGFDYWKQCFLEELDSYLFEKTIRGEQRSGEQKNSEHNVTVEMVLDKYQAEIALIENKEDFLELLDEKFKENRVASVEMFWFNMRWFIDGYVREHVGAKKVKRFIDRYGSDNITIFLTDEKEKMFERASEGEILKKEDQREFELYQVLKQVYDVEMYCKNGTRLKPSFTAVPKMIDALNHVCDIAVEKNIIELKEDSFYFVSFDKIKQFTKLFK